jgi:hypothetical protein
MKKFLSRLLYLFVGFPLALGALFLISVRPWALDREVYRRAVTDDRLYEAVEAASRDRGADANETVEMGGWVYDADALARAVGGNLPDEELKALGLRAVDEALDLAEGADRDGNFDLNLAPLKSAVRARAPQIVRDYVAALESRPETPAAGDFSYRPASLSPAAAEARAAKALEERLDALPDTVSRRVQTSTVRDSGLVFLSKKSLDGAAITMGAVSGILLAGLGALAGVGLAGRIAKAGRYLIPPSVVVMVLGILLWLPGAAFVERLMPPEARALLAGTSAAAFRAYIASVLSIAAKGFFISGLVGTSLGGLLSQAERIAEPKELE